MTTPKPETIEREKDKLYLTDAELIRRLGVPATTFDGRLRSLITLYQSDEDSSYHKARFRTRRNYDYILKRIATDHGDCMLGRGYDADGNPVEGIKARQVLRWHEEWSKRGVTTAHAHVTMLRMVVGFGATLLEDEECQRLCTVLGGLKFPMGGHREECITAEQATAVRAEAHRRGYHAMALAQAFQFECTLRQKDVIGEWIPVSEAGTSDILRDEDKWLRGLRWSEIDQNMILTHVTSKRNKEIVVNLRLGPMVMEELALVTGQFDVRRELLPTSGPVIVDEFTGLPYSASRFRRQWRKVATAAGIPGNVCNMDTRAGAITEATDVASLEDARHAATHSNIATTQRYSRESTKKVAKVMTLRVANRKNKSET